MKRLIYGNEPYLVDRYKAKIKEQIQATEFNCFEGQVFDQDMKTFMMQIPLLSDKNTVIYSPKKLSEAMELLEFFGDGSKYIDVYVFPEAVDKRSKVYKRFQREEIVIKNKLAEGKFREWISKYIQNNHCSIDCEAYDLLLVYLNYYSEETNLYDVYSSLKRICSVERITVKEIKKLIVSHEQENIFVLYDLINSKRYEEMYRQADLIIQNQGSNLIGVMSALLRNYRITYKMKAFNCMPKDIGVPYAGKSYNISTQSCCRAMTIINESVRRAKTGWKAEVAFKTMLASLIAEESIKLSV